MASGSVTVPVIVTADDTVWTWRSVPGSMFFFGDLDDSVLDRDLEFKEDCRGFEVLRSVCTCMCMFIRVYIWVWHMVRPTSTT
jgi:hypothetical protein